MAKNIRRMLAMVMVLCMFLSALPMQALAAEGEPEVKTEEKTVDGVTTQTTTSTTTSTNSDTGNVTVTVEVQKESSGTNSAGAQVQGSGSSKESTVTDSGNNFVSSEGSGSATTTTTSTASDGTVTKVTVESGYESEGYIGDSPIDVPPVEGLPTVEFKEGETNVNLKQELETPATSTSGDVPEDENDNTYDYTKVTVDAVDRTVTGTLTTEEDIVIDPYKSNLDGSVKSEDYEGKEESDVINNKDYSDQYWGGLDQGAKDMLKDHNKPTDDGYDQGYDLLWSGIGDNTAAASAVIVKNAVYLKDENGNYLLDENGEKILDWKNSTFTDGSNNKSDLVNEDGETQGAGMFLAPAQFVLEHENGNYFYAYCMDASTSAQPTQNRWYSIQNIESVIEPDEGDDDPNTYITKDEAGMIRAIANAGYWGSDANVYEYETEEDGTVKKDENGDPIVKKDADGNPITVKNEDGTIATDSSVQGSIASLKELLKSVYKEGDSVTVNYPGYSEGVTYENFYELIDGLTETEALTATQAAIWHFANYEDVNAKDTTNGTVVGLYSAIKWYNDSSKGWLMEYSPAYLADESLFGEGEYDKLAFGESDARMQALYNALLGLDPIYEDGANRKDTNVIPSKEVINDVTVAISDKVADNSYNEDEDTGNDVYHAAVNFTLAFVPDKDSDDLLVALVKGYDETTGEPIYMTDANDNPIIRRLAGKNSDGENYGAIEAVNGVYTLTGLQLGENANHTFDIHLSGTQYLENGVYIYQAFDGTNGPARKASQTLVGMAQGTQHVTVTNTLTFNFNVDEQNQVKVEHFWSEETVEVTPPAPPAVPQLINEEPAPQPMVFRLNHQDPDVEIIPEEPVPLATPAITGDDSGMWVAVILVSVLCMVAINIFDKKRQHETF